MKQLIVNAEHLQTRVALVEDGKIQEYYIERQDSNRIVGSIFKGRIKNLEDSLNAAFVDIGLEKNAFLHYWDMIPPNEIDEDDDDDEHSDDARSGQDGDDARGSRDDDSRGNRRDDRRDDSGSHGDRDKASRSEAAGEGGEAGRSSRSRNRRSRGSRGGRGGAPPPREGAAPGRDDNAPAEREAQPRKAAAPASRQPQDAGKRPAAPGGREKPAKPADVPVTVATGLAAKLRSLFKRDAADGRNPRNADGTSNRGDNSGKPGNRPKDDDGWQQQQQQQQHGRRGGSSRKFDISEIPKRFKVGSEVVVQVTKGMIGDKGPRVTTNLSIPGSYMVLMPNADHKGVSKRIEDRKERGRLKSILHSFDMPPTMGCICRTASEGLEAEFLRLDMEMVLEHWHQAERVAAKRRAPVCIYQEPSLVERSIRDLLSLGIDEIVVDSDDAFQVATTYSKRLGKELRPRIRRYNDPTPIFEHFGLNDQIQKIFRRRIVLPSGSEIAIDETQALVAIDVDTAKSKGKDHPDTILKTNLEAADEVARQLRLRNIGGLVVIDFIDMRSKRDQMKVYNRFHDQLSRDRAKTKIMPISKLGLLEMTRQREHESLQDSIFEPCFYCNGRGLVKSSISISVEIQRRLRELLRREKGRSQIRVTVHPAVLQRLKHQDAKILHSMEAEFGGDLSFRADPNIHQEEFHIIDVKTGKEIY